MNHERHLIGRHSPHLHDSKIFCQIKHNVLKHDNRIRYKIYNLENLYLILFRLQYYEQAHFLYSYQSHAIFIVQMGILIHCSCFNSEYKSSQQTLFCPVRCFCSQYSTSPIFFLCTAKSAYTIIRYYMQKFQSKLIYYIPIYFK